MKINNNQATKRQTLLFLIGGGVVLVGIYFALAHHFLYWPFQAPSTAQQHAQDVAANSQPTKKTEAPTSSTNPNVDATKTTDEIPSNTSVSATITQLEQQNGQVTYAADLNDKAQNGTCAAEYTSDGARPITSTTNALNGICGPVSTPDVQFTKLGTWTLTLRYYVNNTQAVTSKTIIIK